MCVQSTQLCSQCAELQVDASGCIIKLEPYAPWKSHLFDIEEEEEAAAAAAAGSGDKAGKPLYVLYPDANGGW